MNLFSRSLTFTATLFTASSFAQAQNEGPQLTFPDGTWTQVGQDLDGEAANDASGFSVSLSADGSTAIIGAPGNDGNGDDSGHARI